MLITSKETINKIIAPIENFPNNQMLPLIIYKNILNSKTEKAIKDLLSQNNWLNAWTNGIYDFHHYHSNTHETLVIIAGSCDVQFGGEHGEIFQVKAGDVIIIPAGVSHKNVGSTSDFKCIGAYSNNVKYNMNYGRPEEITQALKHIKEVKLPIMDPVFGAEESSQHYGLNFQNINSQAGFNYS